MEKKDSRYEELAKSLTPSKIDYAHTGIKTTLSTIPGFGGVLAEFFSSVVESPLQKRKRDFLILLAKKIDQLESEGLIKIEDLRNDDRFFDLIIHGMEIALKNSKEEKLQSLHNALVNSALNVDINEDLQFTFLQAIDELRPVHIQILKEFKKIEKVVNERDVITIELKKKWGNFLSELVSKGFLEFHDINQGSMLLESAPDNVEYQISDKGKQFLRYVELRIS